MLALSACKGKRSGGEIDLPENFAQLPDTAQVSFMMKNATPDSVARFICASALGKVPQSQIRNLSIATNYAFEKYSDNELGIFSNTYDEFQIMVLVITLRISSVCVWRDKSII